MQEAQTSKGLYVHVHTQGSHKCASWGIALALLMRQHLMRASCTVMIRTATDDRVLTRSIRPATYENKTSTMHSIIQLLRHAGRCTRPGMLQLDTCSRNKHGICTPEKVNHAEATRRTVGSVVYQGSGSTCLCRDWRSKATAATRPLGFPPRSAHHLSQVAFEKTTGS
jgi:hypothetical protein